MALLKSVYKMRVETLFEEAKTHAKDWQTAVAFSFIESTAVRYADKVLPLLPADVETSGDNGGFNWLALVDVLEKVVGSLPGVGTWFTLVLNLLQLVIPELNPPQNGPAPVTPPVKLRATIRGFPGCVSIHTDHVDEAVKRGLSLDTLMKIYELCREIGPEVKDLFWKIHDSVYSTQPAIVETPLASFFPPVVPPTAE